MMRMPKWMIDRLYAYALKKISAGEPDVAIGPPGNPYMERWYVIPRNRVFNVYLHHFHHDDERVLHSHPWWSLSLMLQGWMREYYTPTAEGASNSKNHKLRSVHVGDITFRDAAIYHRLEIVSLKAVTIFMTGPKFRSWFFACAKGLVHWRKYAEVRRANGGYLESVHGAGCGEDDAPPPLMNCDCRKRKEFCDCKPPIYR